MVTQSSVSNYIHTKISFDYGTKVAVVTQYQLPNYFHITTYPLTPLHKSSPPPSAFQFLFLHKPSIEVTKVTESQNSNYIHTTCHVWDWAMVSGHYSQCDFIVLPPHRYLWSQYPACLRYYFRVYLGVQWVNLFLVITFDLEWKLMKIENTCE